MTKHFRRDLDLLRKKVLAIGSLVESATEKALTALVEGRGDLSREVLAGDERIDQQEVEVETECLKILALHQPFAQDLRFLVTVLKVNNDLERIGDLAVNIAERAILLSSYAPFAIPGAFREMAQRTRAMVRDSLDALLARDPDRAREVLAADDAVDRLHRGMFDELLDVMRAAPDRIDAAVCVLSATRSLERIADLATNVAEDIVYLVEGDLIRHGMTMPIDD